VPGLLALQARGHHVHVRTLPKLVPALRAAGLDASPVSPDVVDIEVGDYTARSDSDRLRQGQGDLMRRGRYEIPDLADAIAAVRPDALLVDTITYGAQTHAQAAGIPYAIMQPSVIAVPERGIPPYGLGLRPKPGPVGRVRDAVLWRVVERLFARTMLPGLNELRASAGLRPFRSPLEIQQNADAVIALTAEPLEYPRRELPANTHLVGVQPWELPAERPAYLDEPGDPWVLVTCSTDYQGDERLAVTAARALAGEPVRVLITATSPEPLDLPRADNVRLERFVPHGHVLPQCAAVVCHGGMGIVAKAMLQGVPMVVVPFGRDQPEIARRVTEAGSGRTLKPKQLTPQRLRAAVRTAMASSDRAAQAAAQLAANSDPAKFADAALTLVRNGHHAPIATV
jgi:MGT family glycosyltransferase